MKKILLFLLFLCLLKIPAQNKWKKLNGPEGGCSAGLISEGDTILVGMANTSIYTGTVFYSTNKGNNWARANGKFSKYFIDFVFTNDGGIIGASLTGGLYKSFDFINWTKVYSNGYEFWSLGKDNKGILYAGTDNGYIYYSSNNGVNWNISFNKYNDRIVRFLTLSSGQMFAGAIGELFIKDSTNPTWTAVNVDTTLGFIRPFSDENDNIYFLSYPYFYNSSDVGKSWNTVNIKSFFAGNYSYDCIFNKRMIVSCGDETGWFGNGWGMAISDDTGKTWKWNNEGMPPKFSSANRLVKSGNDTYVGTNAAGVFRSTNFGDNWFPVNNGITAADTWVINFDNEGTLYSACWSNSIQKSTDKGLTWTVINKGFTNSYFMSVASDKNGILLVSTEQGTYRSTDKGNNWTQLDGNFYYYFFTDNFNRIYGLNYGNGLFRTTDQGNSWTKLDKGFISGYVFGFAIDSSNNIYTGTDGGAIYKSTDDGFTWSNVYQSNNSNSLISYISIAPNGYIFASNVYEGILRSTDNGLTWSLKKTDTGSQDTYPLGINKKGTIYASGSNSTFFSSTDNGDTWIDVTNNLALTTVRDIKFDNDDKMYLGTDESVWTSNPDTTVGIKDKSIAILNYSLSQNYPNPFNPTTTINYSVKNAGLVKIDIYDILGRKVETLVEEVKQPGNYSVSFNAKSISSGVYLYKLQINDYTSVKKMIFLK